MSQRSRTPYMDEIVDRVFERVSQVKTDGLLRILWVATINDVLAEMVKGQSQVHNLLAEIFLAFQSLESHDWRDSPIFLKRVTADAQKDSPLENFRKFSVPYLVAHLYERHPQLLDRERESSRLIS